jgi:hypothetical protein
MDVIFDSNEELEEAERRYLPHERSPLGAMFTHAMIEADSSVQGMSQSHLCPRKIVLAAAGLFGMAFAFMAAKKGDGFIGEDSQLEAGVASVGNIPPPPSGDTAVKAPAGEPSRHSGPKTKRLFQNTSPGEQVSPTTMIHLLTSMTGLRGFSRDSKPG